jgi:hypothetical protein
VIENKIKQRKLTPRMKMAKGYLMVEALVDWSKDVERGASNARLLMVVPYRRCYCIAPNP